MSRGSRGALTRSKRRTVLARDRSCCHYCATPLTFETVTLDHVWPKALGGGNRNANLVAACQPCNEGRGEETDKCRCDFCTEAMRSEITAGRPPTPRIHRGHATIASVAEVAGFKWTSDGWKAYREVDR